MKINQVEELTGITRKNIRFYEEEGLISPKRNPANGYREYSLQDVDHLNRIRLLRRLGISCEDIRNMQEGKIDMAQCLDSRLTTIAHHQRDLMHSRQICEELMQEKTSFAQLNASVYLEKMKELEKGGIRFMDVRESDVRVRRTGAIAAAAACIAFFVLMLILIFIADREDPAPRVILVFVVSMFIFMIIGIAAALRQRLKEVKKGEIYEASKY